MITLNFNNPNSRNLTQIAIYRENVGVEIPDPPVNPPIVVLDGFATSYQDTNTVEGQNYNYRIRIFKEGGESTLSDNIVLGDVSLYGPGPYNTATSGSDLVWILGIVDGSDQLPSIQDLGLLAGSGAYIVGWSGKWLKFKVASDIYYTPYGSYIKIDNGNFEAFMNAVATKGPFAKGYTTYDYIHNITMANILGLLDGNTPTLYNIQKEYPRQNACASAMGNNPAAIDPNVRIVYKVTNETNGLALKPMSSSIYDCCGVESIYMPTYDSKVWYWKPIVRFLPQATRNPV